MSDGKQRPAQQLVVLCHMPAAPVHASQPVQPPCEVLLEVVEGRQQRGAIQCCFAWLLNCVSVKLLSSGQPCAWLCCVPQALMLLLSDG